MNFPSFCGARVTGDLFSFFICLSGSYQSALQSVEMLKEEYDNVEIHIIDTKAASLGQGC